MTVPPPSRSSRPVCPPRPGSRAAAFLQLFALLCLLTSPFLPALVRSVASHPGMGSCRGDHRLCGCPPARIANHTCCCSRAAARPSCCAAVAKKPLEGPAQPEADAEAAAFSTVPCGGEDPAPLATDDPWLPEPVGLGLAAALGSASHPLTAPTAKLSPSPQPDVPPPQSPPLS